MQLRVDHADIAILRSAACTPSAAVTSRHLAMHCSAPRYAPELNPAEEAWSLLRRAMTNFAVTGLPGLVRLKDLNGFLCGWAGYFRYEPSGQRLSKIRRYAQWRLAHFIRRRYRRSMTFGWRVLDDHE
ncbi:group II intron maturase-specific domain-containing protein [Nonomuraea helvata]|uniref:Group II intron maturase-specific domain-containing protein n=1 Tax=Nonomuraea helvata TaxID=37484 RepID=A0ABV5SFV1_9ACTN